MTTIHTRQLQQYTLSTNNNYTKDNLKLATKHTKQIQHVQKFNMYKSYTRRVDEGVVPEGNEGNLHVRGEGKNLNL